MIRLNLCKNTNNCFKKYMKNNHLTPESFGLENNNDEENIGKDNEAREYPDKNIVICKIVTLPNATLSLDGGQGDGCSIHS